MTAQIGFEHGGHEGTLQTGWGKTCEALILHKELQAAEDN